MTDRGLGSWVERRAREPVLRLAHGLKALGAQRGDRVGWLGANHPAFLEVLFATAKIGAVLQLTEGAGCWRLPCRAVEAAEWISFR